MISLKTHSLEQVFKEHEKVLIHPLANLFPAMGESEFAAFVEDIKANGVREPVWIYEGRIIDGRHRFVAATENNILCPEREYEGSDPLGFVLSLNLSRRHLNESQRAMVAAKIANLKHGQKKSDSENSLSQADAAESLNVSVDLVKFAKKVQESAVEEVVGAVERGELSVSAAAKLADKTPEYQERVMQKLNNGEASKPTEAMRQIRHEERPNVKAPDGKYRVIYADPPWSYSNDVSAGFGGNASASDHYPCMSIQELCDLPIKDIAEDNAVLFMWVTSPLLEECFPVIKAWGFNYKTSMVWDKMKHNVGHYVSVRHELLLICTRGSCTPDSNKLLPSVVSIERSKVHSQKPEEFRKMIEQMYTHGNKIELFARTKTEGWEVYGNEPEITRVA